MSDDGRGNVEVADDKQVKNLKKLVA